MFRPLTAAANTLISGATYLVGFSLRETSGSTAVVRLRDGSAGGQILFTLSFAADESLTVILPINMFQGLPRGGFSTPNGVYVENVSGNYEGSIFTL